MKQSYLIFCLLCLSIQLANAQVPKTLFFENSDLPYGFSRSLTSYVGHSWIKNYHKKLPVSDTVFFTPGNALELRYTSDTVGHWRADVYANSNKGFTAPASAYLRLKIFIQSETSAAQLPYIRLIQSDDHLSDSLVLSRYITDYTTGEWLSARIKLSDFAAFQEDIPILGVRFSQGESGEAEHDIYIDQLEIVPSRLPHTKLTGAAVLSSVASFERHAILQWKLPLTPSIRYIQIYRSDDNKNFKPIAIRTVPAMTYTDILPDVSKTYYYKIAWVDYGFEHSPFSAVKSAKSSPMTDEALLKMVQEAHIRYYLSGEDFYSGLQRLNRHLADVKVSTKGTGLGIMALIVGVRHQLVSRADLRGRVDRICDFLLKAETYQGAFPAIMNGKTGTYAGVETTAGADLEATAYLMQGLLVARAYFDGSSTEETDLREKITRLWRNIEWNRFKKEGEHYLYSRWSPSSGFAQAHPLSGQSSIPVYIMAMASPTFNIEIEDYENGMAKPMVFQPYKTNTRDSLQLLMQDSIFSQNEEDHRGEWVARPFLNGTVYKGIPLAIGNPTDPLARLLMAFVAFDPKAKTDDFANYYDNINHLIQIQARSRQEQTSGFLTLTQGIPVSTNGSFSNQLDFNSAVALYAFNPAMGLHNLKRYYRQHTDLCWSENGFKSLFDANKNQYLYVEDAAYKALVPVMIENGRNGMIWDLFMKDPDIKTIVTSLFR